MNDRFDISLLYNVRLYIDVYNSNYIFGFSVITIEVCTLYQEYFYELRCKTTDVERIIDYIKSWFKIHAKT